MPWWFIAAFVPMIASQIVRLYQHDPGWWLACDYAGRLGSLAVLAINAKAAHVAFARAERKVTIIELAAWVLIFAYLDLQFTRHWVRFVEPHIPLHALGGYPTPHGWLLWVDATLGLGLVAFHEEVIFRRCARTVLTKWLGDGIMMILIAAFLFGAYHWWTGLSNVISTAVFGVAAMVIYRRTGVLWPLVVAHYLVDLVIFYVWPYWR